MTRGGIYWGVAGYGDVVVRRIAPALADRPFTIWGRDPERTQSRAAEAGARAATSFEAMCGECDAIYVAMPVIEHFPLILSALRAGRPVLCEKPLAGALSVSACDAETIAAHPMVGVAYYRRLAPAMEWLRDLLAAGTLGIIRTVELDYSFPFLPARDDPMGWRMDRDVAGGGVLADAGSHRIDLLLWLFGPPLGLVANIAGVSAGGSELEAVVELDWATGMIARCRFCWNAGASRDRFAVTGTLGSVLIDLLDSGIVGCTFGGERRVRRFPPPENSHALLLADFERAIFEGVSPCCPSSEALQVDAVLRAAYASSGARVQLDGYLPQ